MSVDAHIVRHIARLARIAVSDSEVEALAPELSNILGWIEQLQEVDVSGVQPMTAVIPNTLRLRDDRVSDGVRSGEFSARDVASAFVDAAEKARGLNAFVVETPEHALAAADAADQA